MAEKKKPLPWERQEGETQINYEAFCVYRDMKAKSLDNKRSIRRVSEELGKSEGLLERWSSKFDWGQRVDAFDDDQERKEREAAEKERLNDIKKMRKRHADIATAMLVKAAKALKTLPDEDIKAADISRMVDVASKLERISRGDVGEVVEERDGGQATPAVQIYIPANGRDKKDDDFEDLEV